MEIARFEVASGASCGSRDVHSECSLAREDTAALSAARKARTGRRGRERQPEAGGTSFSSLSGLLP